MKHIKNSIKGSIFLLEHAGVPVTTSTDFQEPIKNGSLCVDTTNQNLYILSNGIWIAFGTGFSSNDWIPRGGTVLNKPVYGNIEISDGKAFYSGQSSISFSDAQLILGFSNNDLNLSNNLNLILNRNYVIQSNNSVVNIDSTSQHNYINKITTILSPGVILSNSSNNTINSNITNPLSLTNSDNNQISGKIQNTSNFSTILNSSFILNTTPSISINNGNNLNITASIEQTNSFNISDNTYFNLRGKVYGVNSIYQLSNNNFIEGTFKNITHKSSNFISFYGNMTDTIFNNNEFIYNLGHITANSAGILTGSASTSSILTYNNGLYNLGVLGLVNINQTNNTLLLGKNTNISINNVNDNLLSNNNGYLLSTNSNTNILMNNSNTYYPSAKSFIQSSI